MGIVRMNKRCFVEEHELGALAFDGPAGRGLGAPGRAVDEL